MSHELWVAILLAFGTGLGTVVIGLIKWVHNVQSSVDALAKNVAEHYTMKREFTQHLQNDLQTHSELRRDLIAQMEHHWSVNATVIDDREKDK